MSDLIPIEGSIPLFDEHDQDVERASLLMAAISADESPEVLMIDGEPRSKARPFRGKNNTVYVDPDARARAHELKLRIGDAVSGRREGNIAVACIFYRSSAHRVDVDNLLKQVLDCSTGVCWDDDSQVTAVVGVLELDRQRPRTVIALGSHSSSMDRGDCTEISTCEYCGKSFAWRAYESIAARRFCSRSCAAASSRVLAEANCRQCGEPFRRRTAGQSLCSEECRRAWWSSDRKAARKHADAVCEVCGGKVSRPEYRRCRACWRKQTSAEVA